MTHQLTAFARPSDLRPRYPFHKVRLFRAPGPGRDRSLLPSAWWLSVLFLGSLALVMMSWGAYSLTPHAAEKDLRAERASPKLSISGGQVPAQESPARLDLEPVAVAVKDQAPEPLSLPPVLEAPLPLQEPVKIELPAPPPPAALPEIALPRPITDPLPVAVPKIPEAIAPPLIAVASKDPIITEHLAPFVAMNVNLGDTPMIRNWKMVAFYSLFASAFAQAPAFAGEKDNKDEIIKRLDKLQKSSDTIDKDVKDLKGAVGGLKTAVDGLIIDVEKLQENFTSLSGQVGVGKIKVQELERDVKDLKIKVSHLSGGAASPGPEKAVWEDLKKTLGNIEQALLRLQPTDKRVAFSPPTNGAGRVVLINLYGERLMFSLNGKTYVVEPNNTLPIDGVTAGVLAYEVRSQTWGVRSRETTTLNPNETFTLTAR